MRNIGVIVGSALSLLILTTFSCQTPNTEPLQIVNDAKDDQYFQELFDQKDFHRALELLFSGQSDLQPEQESQWQGKFIQALGSSVESNNYDPDFNEALRNSITLANLKGMALPSESLTDIQTDMLFYSIEEKYYGAAAVILRDMENLDHLSTEDLRSLENIFLENPITGALDVIAENLNQRGQVLSSALQDRMDYSATRNDLVDGTVTLWVDKGIRVEDGVGVPDRMIGSGFFIDPQGYLLTNYHVIASEVDPGYEGYSRLYIKLNDREGERIPARVVGWDPVMDLALVKTEMEVPYVFSFANDHPLELGTSIFAIGSPGGLDKTLTTGTISSNARHLQELGYSLQVDVPINPGNSGGPLLDQQGKVIGVVFAGIEEFEGINFATPGIYVKSILPRLYQGGKVEYSWFGGVVFKDLDRLIFAYGLPGSPARMGGLKKNDEILEVNHQEVNSVTDIQNILFTLPSGTLVSVKVIRDGVEREFIIPLGARPDFPMGIALNSDSQDNLILPIFGMDVERLNTNRKRREYRVSRVFPGSIADETGIQRNDSIKIYKWEVNPQGRFVLMQFLLEGQTAGYLEKILQIGSWFTVNSFI